jgi:pimeloyl-ACP methyl ester carboxylesterase
MGALAYERQGTGEPVVLLHGTGASRRCWKPVIGAIAADREVIAIDHPGCGESPPLDEAATPERIAAAVAETFDELGLSQPAIAGHSMGGWVGLELAKRGAAGPLLALAPAGLWRRHSPLGPGLALVSGRIMGRVGAPLAKPVLKTATGRALTLRPHTVTARDVDPQLAIELAEDARSARNWWKHFIAARATRFEGGGSIATPVTVVFGDSDRIAPAAKSQNRDELPAHAVWETWPNCGHMVMWDAPDRLVTAVRALGAGAP